MRNPVCITWEQFIPRFEEIAGVYSADRYLQNRVRRIAPIGEGTPLQADDRYRLHEGRYAIDDAAHRANVLHNEHAVVATFNGAKVGVITGVDLWVAPEHRRNATNVDIAAEMWAAHVLAKPAGIDGLNAQHYVNEGKPIPLIKATIKTSKRAYQLLVQRGYIVMPEGYVVPTI